MRTIEGAVGGVLVRELIVEMTRLLEHSPGVTSAVARQ